MASEEMNKKHNDVAHEKGGCCGGSSGGGIQKLDLVAPKPSDMIGAGVEAADAARSCCHSGDDEHPDHGYLSQKKRYLARLRRIEGQVRGIHRMVDEEQYCIDVLTQISAANSALKALALALLDDHLHHCVLNAGKEGEEQLDEKLAEAFRAISRLAK